MSHSGFWFACCLKLNPVRPSALSSHIQSLVKAFSFFPLLLKIMEDLPLISSGNRVILTNSRKNDQISPFPLFYFTPGIYFHAIYYLHRYLSYATIQFFAFESPPLLSFNIVAFGVRYCSFSCCLQRLVSPLSFPFLPCGFFLDCPCIPIDP